AWWYKGYFEIGGRAFFNDPQRGATKAFGNSLAKYYEYSTIAPRAFRDAHFWAGAKNGVYDIDFLAQNVGHKDQRYDLSVAKVGEHYFNFQWDSTPHVYSTSAQTLYYGVGTNALTIPANIANSLQTATGGAATVTAANAAIVRSIINGSVHQTDIG